MPMAKPHTFEMAMPPDGLRDRRLSDRASIVRFRFPRVLRCPGRSSCALSNSACCVSVAIGSIVERLTADLLGGCRLLSAAGWREKSLQPLSQTQNGKTSRAPCARLCSSLHVRFEFGRLAFRPSIDELSSSASLRALRCSSKPGYCGWISLNRLTPARVQAEC